MLDIIVALILGILIGTFTGITPGIHINTVTALLVTNLALFSSYSVFSLVVFVVSLAITHTILDFIPSILTGATDEESFLSVLPGHVMLKEGKGKEAVFLVLTGTIISSPLIILLTPIFIKTVPIIYNKITYFIPLILIFISVYTISREDKISTAFVIFTLTGFLGYASFNLAVKDPLLPMLGGLFGASSIIISLKQKTMIPKQKDFRIKNFRIIKADYLKSISGALISSPLCSFLPGLGSGQAGAISSEIVPQSRSSFLIMLGIINMLVMIFSFVTLYAINKTRTGAAAAIRSIVPKITLDNLWSIILVSIITLLAVCIIAIFITHIFIKVIEKINYNVVSIVMLIILFIAIITLSNPLGVLVFITSTAMGIFAIESNVRRIHMMGCLLLPTILIYLQNSF